MNKKAKTEQGTLFTCPCCHEQQRIVLPKDSMIIIADDGFIEFYMTKDGVIGYVICGSCDYRR